MGCAAVIAASPEIILTLTFRMLQPGAQEAGDAPGAAAIRWLQGDRQGTVHTLLQSIPPVRPTCQGVADELAAETHLLDYLHHCTASQSAELRGGSAMLVALCSAAQRSMHALEAAGLPAMALEALSMARAMCKGGNLGILLTCLLFPF